LTTGDIDALAVWEPWIANAVVNADSKQIFYGGCTTCDGPGISSRDP